MRVTTTTQAAAETSADTIAVGLLDGEEILRDTPDGALAALVGSGEAKARPGHLALTRSGSQRIILVGLGERAKLDGERLRAAAAKVLARAGEIGTAVLCWELPSGLDDAAAGAIVEGTLLAAHRDRRFRSAAATSSGEAGADEGAVADLLISDGADRSAAVSRAVIVSEAVNAARMLQDAPANHMTPSAVAERARAVAGSREHLSVEVEGREQIVARGMGAFAAVAQGTEQEPALITLRYEPPSSSGPVLGLVGKAVTFDSGGISIKPSASMADMKYDMSGGAAVLETIGAIARLELPVRVVAVIGATENLLSGRAMKPGDVVTTAEGLTVQIDNTDAEGRLVLADCLHHARAQGAERLVDVATLTGAMVVALGSTYAGLLSNDDAWAESVLGAAARAGELVWRLPLHEQYSDAVKGSTADLTNAPAGRKAGGITAAAFLQRFAGEVPWAHLDIAGTAWDTGRPYAKKGGTGTMVRTLVALAEDVAGLG